MAAIMRDSIAGRWHSLANRMDSLTHRTLRALGARANHAAYRMLRPREVPSPPSIGDWASAIESSRNGHDTRESGVGQLIALLTAGVARPTSPSTSATSGSVPSAPDLAAAIRAARRE